MRSPAGEATRVRVRMEKLASEGHYELYEEEREAVQNLFYADFCGEDETVETIYEFFEEYQYPLDTHTACAMYAAGNYMAGKREGQDAHGGRLHGQPV